MIIKLAESLASLVRDAVSTSKISALSKVDAMNPKAVSLIKSFKVPQVIKPVVKAFSK